MAYPTPPLFLPCPDRSGSAYYEFQYCKTEGPIRKILKSYSCWLEDSLVVSIEDDDRFVESYGRYLEAPRALFGKHAVDWYGINYYTREQTAAILSRLRDDRPEDGETLILWLEKAAAEFNGFFFLGI